jgi:hypothetical protein
MDKWIGVIALIIVSVIGLLRVNRKVKAQSEYRNFAINYLNNFREFSSGLMNESFDAEKYQWLKLNSSKMQIMMGSYGVATYKPPGANFMYNNYQVIVNGITEIKDMYVRMVDGFGLSLEKKMLRESIGMIDDILLTYIGYLENNSEELTKELKNPFVWFREGVRFIVTFPIYLMHWSGLIRYNTYSSISNNIFVKFISFIVGIIAFISSIVTIVTGYTAFTEIIHNFIDGK